MAPTAALLMFAIMYFGIMIDVGLFDPLIRFITRLLGDDPAKVVLGTALLAGAVSLDGDGSTTFIITTSAMLPIYLRLGMSPVVLTCVAGLMNGTLNIVPWGGPTVRAATALGLETTDIFVPMLPSLAAGLAVSLTFAWMLGLGERRRIGTIDDLAVWTAGGSSARLQAPAASSAARDGKPGARATLRTGNLVTVAGGRAPPRRPRPLVGRARHRDGRHDARPQPRDAAAEADLVQPRAHARGDGAARARPVPAAVRLHGRRRGRARRELPEAQEPGRRDRRPRARASSASSRWCSPRACSSACSTAPAWSTRWPTGSPTVIPASLGPFLAVITGILSIPFTFFMSNDAFYFGILPILAESAAAYGIAPVEMARASITGQPVHLQSPLVPAILLLVSLASVNLGDHHKKVLWRAVRRLARDARRRRAGGGDPVRMT